MTESVDGFLKNLEKLHTTKLGEKRIRKNLSLPEDCDPVSFCQNIIKCPESEIYRGQKLVCNWRKLQNYCKCGKLYHNYGAYLKNIKVKAPRRLGSH